MGLNFSLPFSRENCQLILIRFSDLFFMQANASRRNSSCVGMRRFRQALART